ncbi:MnhB domain-containing protein [Tateyamaria pelophila]|uniref:MnhB domain-containing protein n=1 Tax=Tateyamaria pelophila TaxID=328415 RepID=UPI001CC0869F|nr:MnhB domain-containing protein [Tateyamaria pelophila]
MMQRVLSVIVIGLLAVVFTRIVGAYVQLDALRPLAASYVTLSPESLTTPNVITGILITYRGLDTLGEVAVLFMVAASLGLLLKPLEGQPKPPKAFQRSDPGEIVHSGKQVMFPMILTFGAYVIVNGHLSAGGGFQGGAIVAAGVMLLLIATPETRLNTTLLSIVESTAGILFVLLGILGIVLAGGFLDPRFLPAGELGGFISAGAIPLISALLGIKVGAELSVVIDKFRT